MSDGPGSRQLFTNGKIFTGAGERDFASAFRVEDGAFAWVGEAAAVRGEPAVDLGGRTVIPGLLDVHTHPIWRASLSDSADLLPPAVVSLAQLLDRLRAHPALGAGPDEWITGFGYDDPKFPEGRGPLAADLDQVSVTQPVVVWRCDGHSGAANSVALARAGITEATPDPPGARFGRDDRGRLDGRVIELNALRAVSSAVPAVSPEQAIERGRAGRAFPRARDRRGLRPVRDRVGRPARRLPGGGAPGLPAPVRAVSGLGRRRSAARPAGRRDHRPRARRRGQAVHGRRVFQPDGLDH